MASIRRRAFYGEDVLVGPSRLSAPRRSFGLAARGGRSGRCPAARARLPAGAEAAAGRARQRGDGVRDDLTSGRPVRRGPACGQAPREARTGRAASGRVDAGRRRAAREFAMGVAAATGGSGRRSWRSWTGPSRTSAIGRACSLSRSRARRASARRVCSTSSASARKRRGSWCCAAGRRSSSEAFRSPRSWMRSTPTWRRSIPGG